MPVAFRSSRQASAEPKSRLTRAPNAPSGSPPPPPRWREVELVVLDPADRERQIDLERAQLGVRLVRGGEVGVGELARGSRSASRRSPGRACSAPRPMPARSRRARTPRAAAAAARSPRTCTRAWTSRRLLLDLNGRPSISSEAEAELRKEPRTWHSNCPICPTGTTRSSRTSTRRRCASTTTLHHAAYVSNANAALEGTEWADGAVESVLASIDAIPEDKRTAVRNNAGGHANHSLFWTIMSPDGGGEPGGELALGDRRHLRLVRRAQVGGQRRRGEALRQRLDLARLGRHRPRRLLDRRTRTRR